MTLPQHPDKKDALPQWLYESYGHAAMRIGKLIPWDELSEIDKRFWASEVTNIRHSVAADTTARTDGGASEDLRAAYRELLELHAPTLQFHGSEVAAGLALAVSTLVKRFPALAAEVATANLEPNA